MPPFPIGGQEAKCQPPLLGARKQNALCPIGEDRGRLAALATQLLLATGRGPCRKERKKRGEQPPTPAGAEAETRAAQTPDRHRSYASRDCSDHSVTATSKVLPQQSETRTKPGPAPNTSQLLVLRKRTTLPALATGVGTREGRVLPESPSVAQPDRGRSLPTSPCCQVLAPQGKGHIRP